MPDSNMSCPYLFGLLLKSRYPAALVHALSGSLERYAGRANRMVGQAAFVGRGHETGNPQAQEIYL